MQSWFMIYMLIWSNAAFYPVPAIKANNTSVITRQNFQACGCTALVHQVWRLLLSVALGVVFGIAVTNNKMFQQDLL